MDNEEKIMLIGFVVISSFMIYESSSYSFTAKLFPYLAGTIVLIGSLATLGRSYLPEGLQPTSEGGSTLEFDEDELADSAEEKTDDEFQSEKSTRMRIDIGNPALAVALLLVGYVTFGFLFGLLYITPLFVLMYGLWFRVSLLITVVLTVLAAIIANAFMVYTLTPIDEGFLLVIGGVPI